MPRMNRAYFEKKYRNEIVEISKANDADMGVAADMFISNIKASLDMCYDTPDGYKFYDMYQGLPVNYDYTNAMIDWLQVVK